MKKKLPPVEVPRISEFKVEALEAARKALREFIDHPSSIARAPKHKLEALNKGHGTGVYANWRYGATPWVQIDAALSDARYLSDSARLALIWCLSRGPKFCFNNPPANWCAALGWGLSKAKQVNRELRMAGHAIHVGSPDRHVPNATVWTWKYSERPCGLPEAELMHDFFTKTPQYAVFREKAISTIPKRGKPDEARQGYEAAKLDGLRPYADFDPEPGYTYGWWREVDEDTGEVLPENNGGNNDLPPLLDEEAERLKTNPLSKELKCSRNPGKRLTPLPVKRTRKKTRTLHLKKRYKHRLRNSPLEKLPDDPRTEQPDMGPDIYAYGPHGRGWRHPAWDKPIMDFIHLPSDAPGAPPIVVHDDRYPQWMLANMVDPPDPQIDLSQLPALKKYTPGCENEPQHVVEPDRELEAEIQRILNPVDELPCDAEILRILAEVDDNARKRRDAMT